MNELYKQTGNWWDVDVCPSRGFTKEEKKEYDQILGWCHEFNTNNDIEYQKRLLEFIKHIINEDRFDYVSKLCKLQQLIIYNKSLKDFYIEQEKIIKDKEPINQKS